MLSVQRESGRKGGVEGGGGVGQRGVCRVAEPIMVVVAWRPGGERIRGDEQVSGAAQHAGAG